MALRATLSFYSVPTLKPQSSSSLSRSSNKSITTLCSSRSILQAGLIKFDSIRRSRHLSIRFQRPTARSAVIAAAMKNEPLKVMISGAPASGKGIQCELITKKVNGNAPKEDVLAEIDNVLSAFVEKKSKLDSASMAASMAS